MERNENNSCLFTMDVSRCACLVRNILGLFLIQSRCGRVYIILAKQGWHDGDVVVAKYVCLAIARYIFCSSAQLVVRVGRCLR